MPAISMHVGEGGAGKNGGGSKVCAGYKGAANTLCMIGEGGEWGGQEG